MASTVKFDTWQNTAGELIADTAAGARLPLSGNAIINGDFGVWQRGTSLTTAPLDAFLADRWRLGHNGSGTDMAYTRESFSPGEIEALGFGDAEFYARATCTTAGSGQSYFGFRHRVEDVRTFADSEITVSFWAKSSSYGSGLRVRLQQVFGSGGSASTTTDAVIGQALTAGWVRYSFTATLPSVSGKTIGTSSYLFLSLQIDSPVTGDNLDIWGVQLEAGSVATPFRLAGGGSKAAELALCQRYYFRLAGEVDITPFGVGQVSSTSRGNVVISYPVKMRSAPSISTPDATNLSVRDSGLGPETLSTFGVNPVRNSTRAAQADCNTSTSNLVAGNATILDGNTDAIIDFDAEL